MKTTEFGDRLNDSNTGSGSFRRCFRECQPSELLSLGEKALDNSYGEEVQCSVMAKIVFLSPLALLQSNSKVKAMTYPKHPRRLFTSAWV